MMTKDEIKAMIAETIKSNNKKAITAQSLANVLTAMTENSGEGGSGLKYYTITIYRNNTFETWKINADGTSTLVTA